MDFKFADVGEGITEGEIVRWHVEQGEEIEENQTLVEVETDKAIVDIPSPCAGTVENRPYSVGDVIEVGETLVVIDPEDGEEESTTVVGEISSEAEVLDDESESDEKKEQSETLATPRTRKLAEELGVDLEELDGTGEGGRITPEDVRAAARDGERTNDEPNRETDEYGTVEVEELRGVRKRIAEQMQTNHNEIPQVTHMDEVDVTRLVDTLESKRDDLNLEYKLTLTPFFVKALLIALQENPELNATFDAQNETIRYKQYYNIGITVDTDSGLIVPVLDDADGKSVIQLADEIKRLAQRAQRRSLDLSELQGATFTLTNIGFIGGTWATPQVNHPQAGILATGRVSERPSVRDGDVVPRKILPVSLSFDHRVLDGADAARFVQAFGEHLEDPGNFEM